MMMIVCCIQFATSVSVNEKRNDDAVIVLQTYLFKFLIFDAWCKTVTPDPVASIVY